jgi:parallel beta-helix repeat protein
MYNVVEGNVNGFEVSNSDDILLAHNVARGNTVGMAILPLPAPRRPGGRQADRRARQRDLRQQQPNDATPGSILAEVPGRASSTSVWTTP